MKYLPGVRYQTSTVRATGVSQSSCYRFIWGEGWQGRDLYRIELQSSSVLITVLSVHRKSMLPSQQWEHISGVERFLWCEGTAPAVCILYLISSVPSCAVSQFEYLPRLMNTIWIVSCGFPDRNILAVENIITLNRLNIMSREHLSYFISLYRGCYWDNGHINMASNVKYFWWIFWNLFPSAPGTTISAHCTT